MSTSKNDVVGMNVTLGDLRSDKPDDDISIRGINVGGYRIRAKEISGINVSVVMTIAENSRGLTVGCYNRVEGMQRGISVGLFNHAAELFALQIGLINWAENNPSYRKILPFVNLHL